jgi:hypothetical protein
MVNSNQKNQLWFQNMFSIVGKKEKGKIIFKVQILKERLCGD